MNRRSRLTQLALTSGAALLVLHAGASMLAAQSISTTQIKSLATTTSTSLVLSQPVLSVTLAATPAPTTAPSTISSSLLSSPQQSVQLAVQPAPTATTAPRLTSSLSQLTVEKADISLATTLVQATATSKPALTTSVLLDPKLTLSGATTLVAPSATPAPTMAVASGALASALSGSIVGVSTSLTAPVSTPAATPVATASPASPVPAAPSMPKVVIDVPPAEKVVMAAALAIRGEVGVVVGAKALQVAQAAQPEIVSARVVVDPAPTVVHPVPERIFGDGRVVLVPDLAPVDVLVELSDAAGVTIRPLTPTGPQGPPAAIGDDPQDGRARGLELAEGIVLVQLPLGRPTEAGAVFHWLYEVFEDGEFLGYTWSPDEVVDEAAGTVTIPMPVSELQGTLFLPASLTPGFVANHDPLAEMWSGPTKEARGFGYAGPQFTTFPVVAPQVRERLFVYSPVVQNYAWIDALSVGPVGPPES